MHELIEASRDRRPDFPVAPDAQPVDVWPRSVCIVGCGLLGASVARAIRRAIPNATLTGIEPNPQHAQMMRTFAVMDRIAPALADVANGHYDLCVLAAPLDNACDLLAAAAACSDVVMDVCSAKEAICSVAERLELGERFAPTHPMAGLAAPGPEQATPDLFRGRPWLVIDGWPAVGRILPLITALGAEPVTLPSPADHDRAMAAVSHGIHLTSLAAMLAYRDAEVAANAEWAQLTGPGFRDVTRLSASPSGFWVDTLLANAGNVTCQIGRIIDRLQGVQRALEQSDRTALQGWLDDARAGHAEWRDAHHPVTPSASE